MVLFNLWDFKTSDGIGGDGWLPALPIEYAGNGDSNTSVELGSDCRNTPGQACCKRNCNDCAVHVGEYKTASDGSTGTKCQVWIPINSGTELRIRIYRVEGSQEMEA